MTLPLMKVKSPRFKVIGPDEIPIRERPFASEEAARAGLLTFMKRFEIQGFYRDANGEAIPLHKLAARCRIQQT